jgi:polyhydroxyalkanoate synthesis regulator phasin
MEMSEDQAKQFIADKINEIVTIEYQCETISTSTTFGRVQSKLSTALVSAFEKAQEKGYIQIVNSEKFIDDVVKRIKDKQL